MASERIQRRIERLLDQVDAAEAAGDWQLVSTLAKDILDLDEGNQEALAYLKAAERRLESSSETGEVSQATADLSRPVSKAAAAEPAFFAAGRYEVRRFLGEGGKKNVYLAYDTQLDRDVAFALIKTEGLDDAARQRITREAQAMGRLGSHPHIVTVYDIGEEDGQPYLVLPVLPGGDVEGVIEKAEEHRLPIEQAVKIASETCLGLEFAHSKGIIHRDLKPGNVWLAEDGRAMIGDFGLAVAVDRSRLTQVGMMVGTVNYMAPEQAMGGEVTPRSDLYSLGAMLYEMVCGRPPFVGDESVAIIGQHLNTPPVAPTWHRSDCPPGLEALILRLLEKDASKRPVSAAEVRQALASIDLSTAGAPSEPTASPHDHDPLYRTVFVGREQELRQLQQAYDAAVSGHASLVMVVGEPGIGKTALCEQLATYVSIRGGRTLVGHCYEEGSLSLPYLAFVEAMRTYVLARDPEGLRSDLGSGAADVARIVSEVRDRVHVEIRDASDPEDDRWRLLQSITTFLRNAASVQPLVIVLEDLHWADRGTLDLLQHVARNLQGARLVVVGTYRDVEVDRTHPLSGTLAELRRASNFLRLPLRGLTVDEVHRMYEAIRGNEVPWGQAEAVHRATEGNPLFVQEVLRYLVEEGVVVREEGRYVAKTPGEGVPEGLRDVIGRRLSHLSEQANQVLSIASVIGRDFALEVLQRVAGLSEEEVLAALEEATARSIIEQRTATGSVGFRFTHAFFRQTLYEEIFAPRRIRWHQQVGRALEEVYARRLEEHAAELAEHFAQSTEAADLEKAVHYGELAAQRAMNVFAYGEAVRHLEQAIRAQEVLDPEDKPKRCELLLAMGEAQLPAGEPQKVLELVSPAVFVHAKELGEEILGARACELALDAITREITRPGVGLRDDFKMWADRLASMAPASTKYQARANLVRGQVLVDTVDRDEGLEFIEAALEDAAQLGDRETLFHAAWLLLYGSMDWWRRGIELDDRLATVDRTGVSSRQLSMYVQFIGSARLLNGDREAFEACGRELSMLAQRSHDRNVTLSARANEALRMILSGQLDEALQLTLSVMEDAAEWNIFSIAVPEAARQAAGYLGRERDAVGIEEPPWPGRELARAAALPSDAISGDLENVRRILQEEVRNRDPASRRSGERVRVSRALQLACRLEERELLQELLESAEIGDAAFSAPTVILSTRRLYGDAAAILGEFESSRHYYHTAIEDCDRVRHRPELALSHVGLAELLLDHYPEEHDVAIEHLDFAIAEFKGMKMQPALERALGRRGLLKA